jgi:hypothetical protein
MCQFKFKASQLRKNWKGQMVCEADFEHRHPLDFFRVINDVTKLPFTRPDNDGVEVTQITTGIYCTPMRSQARADIGTADCMRADKDNY